MASLREERHRQALTQRGLARNAQVTTSTIYLIEAGQTRPRLQVMRKVSEALGIPPQEITEFHVELGREITPSRNDRESVGK